MELLYKGHIGTLGTLLYIEVVLNSEVIVKPLVITPGTNITGHLL